jgi:hypothetical protein
MKTQIDLKSALLGLLAGIAVMFAVGAGTSSNPVGKYQIQATYDGGKGFAVLVDTQTGEVWGMAGGNDWGGNKGGAFWGPK